MAPTTVRRTLRWVHIATAGIVGTYLYAPWSADPVFSAITLYGVFPAMALTGVAMWQQGRLMKLMR